MKKILFIIFIAAAIYSYKKADVLDGLMASEEGAQLTDQSGIKTLKSEGGSGFNVNELAVPGQMTVVAFTVSWCPACKQLSSNFKRFTKARPDVVIREVKMKDKWNVAWAKQQFGLDITSTPHVLIFAADGELLEQDEGKGRSGSKLLFKWMDAEVRKG